MKKRHEIISVFRARHESGQTLILAFIMLIILMFAVLFLFDVHQVIKVKIKSRTAVDTAALVGADWQKQTLNAIGEINLIKATTALLDDFVPGSSSSDFLVVKDPNDTADQARIAAEKKQVTDAAASLTQMQVRLSFVGPLLGLAASEQAAKNNGIASNIDFSNVAMEHLSQLEDESQYGPDVLSPTIEGYSWRAPYMAMLREVMQSDNGSSNAIAVAPNVQFLGYPKLSNDGGLIPVAFLRSEGLYDAINGNVWCAIKDLIRMNYGVEGTKWWGDIELISDSSNFPEESEYCTLGINYSPAGYNSAETSQAFYGLDGRNGSNTDLLNVSGRKKDSDLLHKSYDAYDPYIQNAAGTWIKNPNDNDGKINLLPYLKWATYDSRQWWNYGDETVEDWKTYLRGNMKEGTTYRSGAVYYATARVDNETLAGNWEKLADENNMDDKYISDNFKWSGKKATAEMKNAEYRMKNSVRRVHTTALAKPFGRIATGSGYLPPHAAGMILPVFSQSAIIPTSFSDNPGDSEMNNPYFMAFLKEYLPHLGTVDSLSEMEPWMAAHQHGSWFREYHNALLKLNNPEWRAQGIAWLAATAKVVTSKDEEGKEVTTTYVNEDFCNYWPSGGNTPRRGPSSLH